MKIHVRLLVLVALLLAEVPAVPAADTSRLVNLSSRGIVGAGDDVLIAGFVIGGTAPKDILVRALGPTLADAAVSGALDAVRLEVFDHTGKSVASNAQWPATLKSAFTQVGAAALADNSRDAALRLTLTPGNYSVQVSGVNHPRGIAMVEVYEMDGTSRLLNLSTRARVESGDGILISGFVVAGAGGRRVLVRVGGPLLAGLGVSGSLADPTLTILTNKGAVVATNDNWGDAGAATETAAVAATAGAMPFAAGSKDAALVTTLAAGAYSLHVKGVGDATGVALVEVYDVTPPPSDGVPSVPVTPPVTEPPTQNPPVTQNPPPINVTPYAAALLSWTSSAIDARLGPTFAALNPGAVDDRPTLYKPESKTVKGYYVRITPFELGDAPGSDTDYWSDSGQVGYVPDDPANDPGLDRIQTFAYYNKVFAISPRLDWASGKPHSDQQTRESSYAKLNGAPPMQPVAMVRNYAMEQNEEIVIYRDGLFAVAGTQTSRAGSERPYPGFKFPANKIPRAVAVTTSNEFALVTVWDTDRHVGQLAVVALEGKYLAFHTWPYIAFPNQGSFSDFKLLGYIDLPMASPNLVAAASNGLWAGPSSTDNKVLSQLKLDVDGNRKLFYDGAWQATVAKSGYAIVASTEDNQVAVIDLTPLFAYARDSYLKSAESYAQTIANRGPAPAQFPQTFDVNPGIAPRVVWQATMTAPTAVLAGQKIDRWTKDRFKAYVATRDGTIHILDASPLLWRNAWETKGTLQELGTVQVGRNPVSLAFARHGGSNLPLIPNDTTGAQRSPDSLNNLFYAACRGDREVDEVVTWGGQGAIWRRVRDSRMGDPVAVSVARRGNILTVADFAGKKLLSFRMGTITDARNDKVYRCGADGTDSFEFAGELPLAGAPFLVNSTNVN